MKGKEIVEHLAMYRNMQPITKDEMDKNKQLTLSRKRKEFTRDARDFCQALGREQQKC